MALLITIIAAIITIAICIASHYKEEIWEDIIDRLE